MPSFLALAGILSALGLQAPVLLLSHFYSGEVVGWFGLTQRVLAAPLTLIGLSVAQVYLSEIARSRRNIAGDEQRLFWTATRALSALGAVLAVGLLAVGPQVFDVLFGGAWKVSGEFARILAIALAAQLIASPLSQTLIVFERSRLQLLWDASRLLLVSGSVTATATWGSSVHFTVGALCASLTAMYALQWELSRRTLAGNIAKDN